MYVNIWIFEQANSVASIGRLYSDLDSGDDEESHDSRNMVDNAIHVGDEVDESKFFAGVFTTQRTEEDLVGYVKNYFLKRVDSSIPYTYSLILLSDTIRSSRNWAVCNHNYVSGHQTLNWPIFARQKIIGSTLSSRRTERLRSKTFQNLTVRRGFDQATRTL